MEIVERATLQLSPQYQVQIERVYEFENNQHTAVHQVMYLFVNGHMKEFIHSFRNFPEFVKYIPIKFHTDALFHFVENFWIEEDEHEPLVR